MKKLGSAYVLAWLNLDFDVIVAVVKTIDIKFDPNCSGLLMCDLGVCLK